VTGKGRGEGVHLPDIKVFVALTRGIVLDQVQVGVTRGARAEVEVGKEAGEEARLRIVRQAHTVQTLIPRLLFLTMHRHTIEHGCKTLITAVNEKNSPQLITGLFPFPRSHIITLVTTLLGVSFTAPFLVESTAD